MAGVPAKLLTCTAQALWHSLTAGMLQLYWEPSKILELGSATVLVMGTRWPGDGN